MDSINKCMLKFIYGLLSKKYDPLCYNSYPSSNSLSMEFCFTTSSKITENSVSLNDDTKNRQNIGLLI